MNKQEYLEQIKQDCIEYIDENHKLYLVFDKIWDDMRDPITGNDNGSYFCSSFKAKESVKDIIFDHDINSKLSDLGYDCMPIDDGPEVCDVLIRFCLIDELYDEIKEYFNSKKEGDE